MNARLRSTCWSVLLTLSGNGVASSEQTKWPLAPVDADHPLGATLGEFQDTEDEFPVAYQHAGIDVLASPWSDPTDDDSAPWVVATVSGVIKWMTDDAGTLFNQFDVEASDGRRYRYAHLAHQSYNPDMVIAQRNQEIIIGTDVIGGGGKIARVTPWIDDNCNGEYSHLHYDIQRATNFINPMQEIDGTLRPDTQPPDVLAIGLASKRHRNGGWKAIPARSMECAVVKGDIDIVAGVRDRDSAGSSQPGATNIGVYSLRWRVCPENVPECGAWSERIAFDHMPTSFSNHEGNSKTSALFSTSLPWKSDFDECSATVNKTFMVATSAPSEPWDSDTPEYPDGSYSVTVEATDVAGNTGAGSALICVQNETECTTDLVIRDGPDDEGSVPYLGTKALASPDIIFGGVASDEDRGFSVQVSGDIKVRVWNVGSCPLFVGSTYQVCIGWRLPSQPRTGPIPGDQVMGCKVELVPSQGWNPGTARITTFSGFDALSESLQGGIGLEAWSSTQKDPAQFTLPWTKDNNRAMRAVVLGTGPNP